MIFELRQYRIKDGKRDQWVKLMEEQIIPFQTSMGVVVVDVGMNRVDDPSTDKGYRLVGDVHFESVSEVAGAVTPVPGGVGPMTVAGLLHNTVLAAERAAGRLAPCAT